MDYMSSLPDGVSSGAHTDGPPAEEPPPWFDIDKFRRGQRFASDFLPGILYAHLLGLILIFSYPGTLDTLLFTGNSDTPHKAHRRYLSTVIRIISWYDGDLWQDGEARRHMATVRSIHSLVKRRLDEDPERHKCLASLRDASIGPDRAPLCHGGFLREDLERASTGRRGGVVVRGVACNQFEMAVTQFAFVGLVVLRPATFCAATAPQADLDAFVHLWCTIAYLLGIEDKFNLCFGDLASVKSRCNKILEDILQPQLLSVRPCWEHMSHCVVAGMARLIPLPSLAVSVLYLCDDALGLPMPRLAASLCLVQKVELWLLRFALRWLFRLSPARRLCNHFLRCAMEKATKRVNS